MSKQDTMTITGNDVGTLKAKRGPKVGSKKRSKAEIIQAQLAKLLAIASAGGKIPENFANAAEIVKQVLVENAAHLKVAVTGAHPRLAAIRADRTPLRAASKRWETLTRHLEALVTERDKRAPYIDNVNAMVAYYDNCEQILTDAVKAGQNLDEIILPDRPNFGQDTLEHAVALRQSKKVVADSVTPNDDVESSEETEENSDDDDFSEDDEDTAEDDED